MSKAHKESSISLYRKYRPATFKDVVGQDAIVRTLSHSIKEKTISHAYLFAGSRGIGKTSIARIFAKEIGTSQNDLYEIDAASNRGIDDIREIRESVNSSPFDSEYKVYIVDEVHMLTKEAFNALLKTLEEPPSHVIFILATTELHKLPETVISRCQVFQFKKPTVSVLKDVVIDVAKKEGYTIDPSGAELVSIQGDGSFRDTLGILEKIINSGADKKIQSKDVEMVTGAPANTVLNIFVTAVAEKDLTGALKTIKKATDWNIDMKLFLKLSLQKMRYTLLLRYAPDMRNTIAVELSEEDFKFLNDLAGKENNINSRTLSEFLDAYEKLSGAFIPELPLELALVKLLGEGSKSA